MKKEKTTHKNDGKLSTPPSRIEVTWLHFVQGRSLP